MKLSTKIIKTLWIWPDRPSDIALAKITFKREIKNEVTSEVNLFFSDRFEPNQVKSSEKIVYKLCASTVSTFFQKSFSYRQIWIILTFSRIFSDSITVCVTVRVFWWQKSNTRTVILSRISRYLIFGVVQVSAIVKY